MLNNSFLLLITFYWIIYSFPFKVYLCEKIKLSIKKVKPFNELGSDKYAKQLSLGGEK